MAPERRRPTRVDRQHGSGLEGRGTTMYGALWRILPGPRWGKILILVGAGLAVLAVLTFFAFPWVDTLLSRSEEVG